MSNDAGAIQKPHFEFGPGDIRKLGILLLFLTAIVMRGFDYISGSFSWILAALVFIYALDVFYTVAVSQRTRADLKAFVFQTAVPIFALGFTGVVAVTKSVDSSAIVSMFGLSLAYTTYVVGRPMKQRDENVIEADDSGKD